jgi:DNA-binding beta-propeller fold protein YncE
VSPDLGTRLAGYRVDSVLGRGGMGVVYRAIELALDRPVALKLIAPELAGDKAFRERFLRESRLAASIDHPGILPVYAAGEADGELYLATRFVEGRDLGALLEQEGPLAPERALELVGQVADALDAAHRRGLVHRDVKPGNVLVDAAEHCYLCDFGLTKELGRDTRTATGWLAGSLDYVAPEQIRRGDVDGRTDQYALACVLYESLSGAPPFRTYSEAQTLWAHMQEPPPPLAAHPELDPVLARALAKEPDDRYDSCGSFLEDARGVLGLGPSPVAIRRRRRRIGGRLLGAGVALLGLAAIAVVLALMLDSGAPLEAPSNSVGVVELGSLELAAAVPVGNAPTEVAVSDDWVWVLNSNDGAGTISRIDAETRQRETTFSVSGTPRNIVAAFDSLWVGTVEGRVFRVESGTDVVESSWTLPNAGERTAFDLDQGAGWLAVGPNVIFAASARTISRIDPSTSQLRPLESVAWGPMDYGLGSLWVLGRELERLNAGTMRRVSTVPLAGGFVDVATGFGSVWIADDEGRAVLRVDARQEAIVRTYDLDGSPLGVSVGADAVWAAGDDGTVARIDPESDDVAEIRVGGAPRGLDVGETAVWVSVD